MTVAALPRAKDYLEDGVSLAFAVPFRFLSPSDLVVTRVLSSGTVISLAYGTAWSATGGTTDAGGTLTLTASVAGSTLRIRSRTPRNQSTDYQTNDRFPAETHEAALDRAMVIDQEQDQQMEDLGARALQVPFGEDVATIPARTDRADRMLGFDGTGAPAVSNFTMAQVAQAIAAAFNPVFTQLAALVVYLALGVGAVARSVQSRFDDTVHVFDYLTVAQQAAVKLGTVTAGLAAAVQKAIDAAAASGAELVVQPGTYLFDPITVIADEDTSYVTYGALRIRSNMHIRGNGAVFKIQDAVSTDGAPKSMAMFATDEALHDISCTDLVIDMNGANNKISPDRGSLTYNRYNNSAWLVSGTNGGAANAARIDRCRLERNTFKNHAGVCAIVGAQSNVASAAMGSGWIIRDNLFLDNGLDTDDFTGVFGWFNDALIEGNTFYNSAAYGAGGTKVGGNTCYEIHGRNHRIVNNRFVNFIRGVWVSSNLTEEVRRSIIANNVFETMFYGIDFFRTTSSLSEIVDTLIEGNHFFFDDAAVAAVPGLNFKSCVQIASEYRQRAIDVRGNVAYKTQTTLPCAFLTVTGGGGSGQVHTAIRSHGNSGRGLTFGHFIRTIATAGLGIIDVRGNDWQSLTPSTSPANIAAGDIAEQTTTPQTIDHLLMGGGSAIDDRGTPLMNYGARLNTTIGRLDRDVALVRNAVSAGYLEDAGFSVGGRFGFHPSTAFTPQWRGGGTAVTLGDGTVAGRMTISDNTVTLRVKLVVGSTTTIPAGALTFDLPIAGLNGGVECLGTARIFDTSATLFKFVATEIDIGGTSCSLQLDGATNVSNTAPITLATGDVISAQITYQRA